jgi:hypothetical protein
METEGGPDAYNPGTEANVLMGSAHLFRRYFSCCEQSALP